MGASTLKGDSVLDAAGEPVGRIEEIMLDVPSGRIAYAVLAFEPATAGSTAPLKLFAVPWTALRLDAERRCFLLDVARERLRDAPGFDPRHWPTMAQPTWQSTLYEFYGADADRP
jgi:sporulation protein YlmC with PRC-barrel domain